MLSDLEKYFTSKGWYGGTHTFVDIKLEGGFEAFSGRASETWEYRWVINTIAVDELCLPNLTYKGKRFESIDSCADKILELLIEYEKNIP